MYYINLEELFSIVYYYLLHLVLYICYITCCYFFQISMLHLMLDRLILHLKPAPTGPSPRVSLITAHTVSGCLPPLLSLLLCPHQHPHSRDPAKERQHREAGAHLTCENHPSMLILRQQYFSGKLKGFPDVKSATTSQFSGNIDFVVAGMSGGLLTERWTHGNTEQSRGASLTMSRGSHLF